MVSEAQKRATSKWRRENVKVLSVRIYPKDRALYEWFKATGNVSAAMKAAAREYAERNGFVPDEGQDTAL